jgi:hypothetical protein
VSYKSNKNTPIYSSLMLIKKEKKVIQQERERK